MIPNERLIKMSQHYDDLYHAENYFDCNKTDNWRLKISHLQLLTILANLPDFFLNGPRNSLDIGCSSGRYIQGFSSKGFDALGIDTAITPLKYGSGQLGPRFVQGSATHLCFRKDTFDIITCIELLHHFEDSTLEIIFEEIREILKPGGYFIFDIKNKLNPLIAISYAKNDTVNFTLKARTINQMNRLTKKYGFEIIKIHTIPLPHMPFSPYIIAFSKITKD